MAEVLDLPAGDYVPQAAPMLLLERLVSADEETLVATACFRPGSLFERDGRVGSWVALECIAQAVAAWAGYHGRLRGQAPRVGFLLGTSRFECARPWIPVDAPLRVEVRKEIQMDDGLGQFTGQLLADGAYIASAAVTVFGPKDPQVVLGGRREPA